VGANEAKPDWRMFDRLFHLITDVIHKDSTDETREVSADVNTPEEIDKNINPTITYGKGGAIVKMLSYVLGKQTFQKGLQVRSSSN
jgi:aminopeptidase N